MQVNAVKLKILIHAIAQKDLALFENPLDLCDWREISEEIEQLYTARICPDCGTTLGLNDRTFD